MNKPPQTLFPRRPETANSTAKEKPRVCSTFVVSILPQHNDIVLLCGRIISRVALCFMYFSPNSRVDLRSVCFAHRLKTNCCSGGAAALHALSFMLTRDMLIARDPFPSSGRQKKPAVADGARSETWVTSVSGDGGDHPGD